MYAETSLMSSTSIHQVHPLGSLGLDIINKTNQISLKELTEFDMIRIGLGSKKKSVKKLNNIQSDEKIEIFITDFEKEMNKKSRLGSECTGRSPKSTISHIQSIFGSQRSNNSLESVFMDDYIEKKDTKCVVEEKINDRIQNKPKYRSIRTYLSSNLDNESGSSSAIHKRKMTSGDLIEEKEIEESPRKDKLFSKRTTINSELNNQKTSTGELGQIKISLKQMGSGPSFFASRKSTVNVKQGRRIKIIDKYKKPFSAFSRKGNSTQIRKKPKKNQLRCSSTHVERRERINPQLKPQTPIFTRIRKSVGSKNERKNKSKGSFLHRSSLNSPKEANFSSKKATQIINRIIRSCKHTQHKVNENMKLVNFAMDLERVNHEDRQRFSSILHECKDYNEEALKGYFGYKLQDDIEMKQLVIDSVKEFYSRR